MEGEVEMIFKGGYKMGHPTCAFCIQQSSFSNSPLLAPRNPLPRILSGKPANTTNGILVSQVNAINSGTYGDIGFLTYLVKEKSFGVSGKLPKNWLVFN